MNKTRDLTREEKLSVEKYIQGTKESLSDYKIRHDIIRDLTLSEKEKLGITYTNFNACFAGRWYATRDRYEGMYRIVVQQGVNISLNPDLDKSVKTISALKKVMEDFLENWED